MLHLLPNTAFCLGVSRAILSTTMRRRTTILFILLLLVPTLAVGLVLARLINAPKVLHKIRLANSSEMPFTTAPALILRDDRVLAQGLMTYASPGAETDLDITSAVDIRVKKTDTETKRTPNAASWQGDSYGRIDLGHDLAHELPQGSHRGGSGPPCAR